MMSQQLFEIDSLNYYLRLDQWPSKLGIDSVGAPPTVDSACFSQN